LHGEQKAPFLGKPLALKRCLGNLVDNALFYGGSADILISDSERQLEILVRDHGPGIPGDQLERVFQPYTRLAPGASNQAGMGLGLSIVRNIARAHGGDVVLSNHPGGGVLASLTLPRKGPAVA
jgi:signal transduction histidine kinase